MFPSPIPAAPKLPPLEPPPPLVGPSKACICISAAEYGSYEVSNAAESSLESSYLLSSNNEEESNLKPYFVSNADSNLESSNGLLWTKYNV